MNARIVVIGCGLLTIVLSGVLARAGEAPANPAAAHPSNDIAAFAGDWLADRADCGNGSSVLQTVWRSKITFSGNTFSILNFDESSRDLTGTFTVDPTANPKTIDLKVNEFVRAERPTPMKYPACTLPGIFQVEGNRLTICFNVGPEPQRPTGFHPTDRNGFVLQAVRSTENIKNFPTEVTVKAVNPDGTPAPGVSVFSMMQHLDPKHKGAAPGFTYSLAMTTGADSTVKLPYEKLRISQAGAHDGRRKLIGFTAVSPASLREGTVTVQLQPERVVSGGMVCDEWGGQAENEHSQLYTAVYVLLAGRRIVFCDSFTGEFSVPLPPGDYSLYAYGSRLEAKVVPITVPAGEGIVQIPLIHLSMPKYAPHAGEKRDAARQGELAPELEGVVAWKGHPVKLADLRGKVVLLNFWGWWCQPCIMEMPTLFQLHERFKDKDLAIVGVHVDPQGQVESVAQLDKATAGFRNGLWQGKDVPFPVALVPKQVTEGGRGPVKQYGILHYPTTIIIDRQGKIAGEFGSFGIKDIDKAAAAVQKLLDEGK